MRRRTMPRALATMPLLLAALLPVASTAGCGCGAACPRDMPCQSGVDLWVTVPVVDQSGYTRSFLDVCVEDDCRSNLQVKGMPNTKDAPGSVTIDAPFRDVVEKRIRVSLRDLDKGVLLPSTEVRIAPTYYGDMCSSVHHISLIVGPEGVRQGALAGVLATR